ncbi:hypothetical protein ACMX2M_16790 [Paenibacillus polymyxa]|nr:hypothetical protein [Paenibacillus amylolyticus]
MERTNVKVYMSSRFSPNDSVFTTQLMLGGRQLSDQGRMIDA